MARKIIKSKRDGQYISRLETKVTNQITRVFNKMKDNFESVAGMVLQKSNGGSPIDILVDLGFEEIAKILEEASLTTYAFAYKNIADSIDFEINLDKVSKQALKVINERKEFYSKMGIYTKEKLAESLNQALQGNISYNDYLKQSQDIFILDKKRGKRIAINEIGSVYVESSANAIRDAQMELGVKVQKRWNNVGDNNVSDGCRDNQDIGYVSTDYVYRHTDGLGLGDGAEMPPRFVGCRCALDYEVQD